MNKIYDFFQNDGIIIQTVESASLFEQVLRDATAMLDLFNLETFRVEKLNQAELFTLHNALIRVKYFQETGKVLNDKNFK